MFDPVPSVRIPDVLVRQIILEINSLDIFTNDTSELSIFSSPFTFYYYYYIFFIGQMYFILALLQSEFPMNNCNNVNWIYI